MNKLPSNEANVFILWYFTTLVFSARLSSMQGAEVEVCEGFLLLSREAEGLGGRRQDWLESSELAVKVADIHGLFD